MKRSILIWVVLLFLGTTHAILAKDLHLYSSPGQLPGEPTDDRPPTLPQPAAGRGGSDTLSFGYVDGDGFAIAGEIWTFDHGSADPFEGWTTTDMTAQSRSFIRHITADIWTNGDLGNGGVATDNSVPAPILSGLGSAWLRITRCRRRWGQASAARFPTSRATLSFNSSSG